MGVNRFESTASLLRIIPAQESGNYLDVRLQVAPAKWDSFCYKVSSQMSDCDTEVPAGHPSICGEALAVHFA